MTKYSLVQQFSVFDLNCKTCNYVLLQFLASLLTFHVLYCLSNLFLYVPVACFSNYKYKNRVSTTLENLEYSGIFINLENLGKCVIYEGN